MVTETVLALPSWGSQSSGADRAIPRQCQTRTGSPGVPGAQRGLLTQTVVQGGLPGGGAI